jgi:hypothetical protein
LVVFEAQIYKLGINPVVDPPPYVLNAISSEAGRSRGPLPVRGRLNGVEFIQTLVKYRQAWRLYINGPMLKAASVEPGDTVRIELAFDDRPRDVTVPILFAQALAGDARADASFRALAPSRRKEILRYLSSLKTPAALERNIARVMDQLRSAT